MQDHLAQINKYSGTTALGAFVIDATLIVFNIGDCQAVLCCKGDAVSSTGT